MDEHPEQVEALLEALQQLEAEQPDWVERVRCRYYGNLTFEEAADLMDQEHIQHLAVTRQGAPIGILSERDLHDAVPSVNLVPDAEARRSYLARVRVEDVATMEPETVCSDIPVLEAITTLRRLRVGSLPVQDRGQLVGIVTSGDLITLLEQLLQDRAGQPHCRPTPQLTLS